MQAQLQKSAAAVYDRVTEAWRLLLGDDLHYGYFTTADDPLDAATEALTARMADWLRPASAAEVLDVGCGTGNPARRLARQFGCRVTGISTSEVGLRVAREESARQGVETLRFCRRDGMDNGFSDSSFDCVWIMESSHLMRRKDRLIAESARVLRREGRLVLCDIILRRPIPFPEVLRNVRPFQCLDAVFGEAKMETLDTYRQLGEQSGLSIDRMEDISDRTLQTFDRWRRNADANRAEVVARVGESYWNNFRKACDYLEGFWQTETLGYGMILATKR